MRNKLDFGSYTVGDEIGRTQTTRSYMATRADGQRVRLTCLASSLTGGATERERGAFERGVRLLGEAAGPEIAPLVDAGTSPTLGLYAAFAEPFGKRLDQVLKEEGKLDEHAAMGIARAAAGACARLGAAGLVHGHLRPSAFVVHGVGSERRATLIDVPVAPPELDDHRRAGAHVEELYLSPEHVAGSPLDERADVHSLGLVFLEMLVGTERFESLRGAMLMAERPFAPEDTLSPRWNRLLARALGRALRTRHESAEELAEELATLFSRRSSSSLRRAEEARPAEIVVRATPAPAPEPAGSAETLGSLELDMGPAPAPPSPALLPTDSSASAPAPGLGPDPFAAPAEEAPPPAAVPPARASARELASRVAEGGVRVAASLSHQLHDARELTVRTTARAADAAVAPKNRGLLALGGLILAVGALAVVIFVVARFVLPDDGAPRTTAPPHTKNVAESAGAAPVP